MENAIDGFICILCGGIFIVAAVIMLVFPPRKINDFYGYRSKTSKKSQQRWDFSQRFSAWRMVEVGIFLFLVSVVLEFAEAPEFVGVAVGMALLVCSCVYLFVRTESALKKKFPS